MMMQSLRIGFSKGKRNDSVLEVGSLYVIRFLF